MTLICFYFNSLTGTPSDYQVREAKPPQGAFGEMCPLEQSHHTLNSNYWVMQTLLFLKQKFFVVFVVIVVHIHLNSPLKNRICILSPPLLESFRRKDTFINPTITKKTILMV